MDVLVSVSGQECLLVLNKTLGGKGGRFANEHNIARFWIESGKIGDRKFFPSSSSRIQDAAFRT